jgi:hypothetical protein
MDLVSVDKASNPALPELQMGYFRREFLIISRVGGRALSVSVLIYFTSSSSCGWLRACCFEYPLSRDAVTPLHLLLSVDRLI